MKYLQFKEDIDYFKKKNSYKILKEDDNNYYVNPLYNNLSSTRDKINAKRYGYLFSFSKESQNIILHEKKTQIVEINSLSDTVIEEQKEILLLLNYLKNE